MRQPANLHYFLVAFLFGGIWYIAIRWLPATSGFVVSRDGWLAPCVVLCLTSLGIARVFRRTIIRARRWGHLVSALLLLVWCAALASWIWTLQDHLLGPAGERPAAGARTTGSMIGSILLLPGAALLALARVAYATLPLALLQQLVLSRLGRSIGRDRTGPPPA